MVSLKMTDPASVHSSPHKGKAPSVSYGTGQGVGMKGQAIKRQLLKSFIQGHTFYCSRFSCQRARRCGGGVGVFT